MSSSHEFARPVSGELFLVMELVVCVHVFGGQCKHKGSTPSFLLCCPPLPRKQSQMQSRHSSSWWHEPELHQRPANDCLGSQKECPGLLMGPDQLLFGAGLFICPSPQGLTISCPLTAPTSLLVTPTPSSLACKRK